MNAPNGNDLVTWATAIATLIILVRQQILAYISKDTNKVAKQTNVMVNGQHGAALETIRDLTTQVAAVTGNPDDIQKVVEATAAVEAHKAGTLLVKKLDSTVEGGKP